MNLIRPGLHLGPGPAFNRRFRGISVGPVALQLINFEELGEQANLVERAARLTLGIGLVGVALRIPREYPRRNRRSLLWLTAAGMLPMWAISTGLVYFILGLPFWLAALIAAIITPTDPVAASPIVTGMIAEKALPIVFGSGPAKPSR